MIVFILPGQKGKGKCYTDIKKLLYTSIPVPSQVVLSTVISKGKNLRSIINKVLIQMNAKMGGVPWSLENLSLVQNGPPTTLIGYSIQKKGRNAVAAIVSS